MKQLILVLTIIIFLTGCSSSATDSIQANTNTTLAIEGMTCETGCAKRIEQKIAKMEGVKSCEVNFEKKLATVIYDDKKVASTKFVDLVEGLNDNQYKVSNIDTEKISNSNSESSSNGGEETGNILSGSSFELPNIMEYLRNII
jgi:copper chaperone CopZ